MRNEKGEIVLMATIGIAAILGVALVLMVVVTMMGAAHHAQEQEAASTASGGVDDGTGSGGLLPGDAGLNDSGPIVGRRLRCTVLPGLGGVKTKALDARVALNYWKPAYEQMRAEKVPIQINFAFRSVCDQIYATARAGGNATAPWPTKLGNHLLGCSLDVNGIGTTANGKSTGAAYQNRVYQILVAHGWRWFGPKDWPHFDVTADKLGETNREQWGMEIQKWWYEQSKNGGGELSGCMGGPCSNMPELLAQRARFIGGK